MYKLAEEIKLADVRGCLAAFVDTGLVKIAGDSNEEAVENFEKLAYLVSKELGSNDYDIEDVAVITEQILSNS